MEYIIKTDDSVNRISSIQTFLEMMVDSLCEDGETDNPIKFKVEVVENKDILK